MKAKGTIGWMALLKLVWLCRGNGKGSVDQHIEGKGKTAVVGGMGKMVKDDGRP